MIHRTGFKLLLLYLSLSCLCRAQEPAASDARYHLHPGDSITIEFRYSPEFNTTVFVQPDGYVTVPFVGQVKLSGYTIPEVHDLLVTKASERLNAPEISVVLKDFEKPYYIVGGYVASPGRFDIRGRMTALRAIEIAGGFKPFCKANKVLIIRPINDVDGQTFVIDLKRVTDKRDTSTDMELHAGDLVIVPKSNFGKIEPYIHLINAGIYYNPAGGI